MEKLLKLKKQRYFILILIEFFAIAFNPELIIKITFLNALCALLYYVSKDNKHFLIIDSIFVFILIAGTGLKNSNFLFLIPIYIYLSHKNFKNKGLVLSLAVFIITVLLNVLFTSWESFHLTKSTSLIFLGLIPLYISSNSKKRKDKIKEKEKEIISVVNEKIKAFNEITSALSHKIKNPIASLSGVSKLIEKDPSIIRKKEDRNKILKIIERETKKLNDLSTNFVSFTKPKKQVEEAIDLIKLLNEITHSLEVNDNFMDKKLKFKIKYDSKDSNVIIGDIEKVSEALENVILNAIDESYKTKNIIIEIKETDYTVEIKITNLGPTIKEDVKNKIFNPFFTTKKNGTGLGLSIARSTIKANSGEINFTSKNKVTTFTVSFKRG